MDTGDTLYIPVPGTSLDSHLWVVISDPISNPMAVVIVSFTKHRADKDQGCILDVGDHSFIRQRTCVAYRQAKVVSESELEVLVAMPDVKQLEPVLPDVLQRILDGVPNSRMPLEIAQVLADQGLISL